MTRSRARSPRLVDGRGTTASAPGSSPLLRLAASPSARRLAAAALLGRIAMGMIPLALILTVTAGAGSYGAAGAVTGAYALGVAVGGPVRGRLGDRIGVRPVLLGTGCAHTAALVAFAAVSQTGFAPAAPVVALLIGLWLPPTGPAMRVIWDRTLGDEELRRTAQALESVALDIGLLTGPLAVATLAAIGPPAAALLVAAALTVASSLGVAAAARAVRGRPASAARDALGALRPARLRRALAVSIFAIGSLFPVEIAVVAFTSEHGDAGSAGLLLGAYSMASLLAGLLWATRRRGSSRAVQLVALLTALAAGFGVLVLAPTTALLAGALVLAGVAVSPMLIVHFDLIRAAAPADLAMEAFSWVSALGYGGGAAAAAAAGAAIDRHGADAGFIAAAAMAATAAVVAASTSRASAEPISLRPPAAPSA